MTQQTLNLTQQTSAITLTNPDTMITERNVDIEKQSATARDLIIPD